MGTITQQLHVNMCATNKKKNKGTLTQTQTQIHTKQHNSCPKCGCDPQTFTASYVKSSDSGYFGTNYRWYDIFSFFFLFGAFFLFD